MQSPRVVESSYGQAIDVFAAAGLPYSGTVEISANSLPGVGEVYFHVPLGAPPTMRPLAGQLIDGTGYAYD